MLHQGLYFSVFLVFILGSFLISRQNASYLNRQLKHIKGKIKSWMIADTQYSFMSDVGASCLHCPS